MNAESFAQSPVAQSAAAHDAAAGLLRSGTHRPEHWARLAAAHTARAEHLRCGGDISAPTAALSARAELTALRRAAAELPPGEMGISRPRLDLRVGIICDRFLFDTFTGLAELVPLTPQNWREHLGEVDLLLVAATWRGHDGHSWDATADDAPARHRLLVDSLIPAYRDAGVPTVYYGKEDPPDYRRFLAVARACEHILTTAVEVIGDYRRDCPEARSISVLPFAVNPLLHTPLGSRPARSPAVLFAGSWMGRKYPLRAEYARWVLDGVLAADRAPVIIDRYYDAEHPSANQLLPYRYWSHRVPAVDHTELMGLQRAVDLAVNLNSVPDSQTMFANRAIELQASGTAVLSTYSQGLNSYYPQVHMANSPEDVAAALRRLDADAAGHEELRRVQADGIRQVFWDNHGVDLLARLAEVAGVDVTLPKERVLAVTEEVTEQLAADIAAQTHQPLTLVTWTQVSSGDAPEAEILMPVSPERRYSPDYARDHVIAFRMQSAPISVKLDGDAASTDAWALRHRQGLEGLGSSLTAFWRPALTAGEQSAPLTLSALHTAAVGRRVYVGDHLNHRPAASSPGGTGVHTELSTAAEACRRTARTLGLELSVIIPIFNNGRHLRHRAFASLARSPGFQRMHVLLVDDGSTDGITPAVVAELAAEHPHVTAFCHPPGGSGSASRPRNLGLELAATEFVTYLDPDDEQCGSAYTDMADLLSAHPQAQFALGTQHTWSDRRRHLNVHSWLDRACCIEGMLRRPGAEALQEASFRPASIEGLVARTTWLRGLGLEQPVGATGQDTLFFQQLFHRTEAYLAVPEPAYIYYGAVDTSIVNVVSPRYFRKYLIIEAARAQWLRAEGLLEAYLQTRFEHFLITWYLPQLALVPEDERAEAEAVLRQIVGLYTEDPEAVRWRTPEALRFFGHRALPDLRTLRPTLGRWRRRLRTEAGERVETFRRTAAGRAAGSIYRRTLKPQDPEAAAELVQMRADEAMLASPTSAVSEADRWERRL